MDLVNKTPYGAAFINTTMGEDDLLGAVIARPTFRIEGERLVPTPDEPWPVGPSPEETAYGEFPGDVPFLLGGVDVFVFGNAHQPKGEPGPRLRVDVRVGQFLRAFEVIGDRRWEKQGDALVATAPEPFVSLPLTYENAYGGSVQLPEGEYRFMANPPGKGICFSAEQAEGVSLPNLEDPEHLIATFEDQPEPVGLAPYPAEGMLKQLNSIEYDADPANTHITQLKPLCFNNAHPKMIIEPSMAPKPGDRVEVTHAHPDGDLYFDMPEFALHAHVQLGERNSVFPAASGSGRDPGGRAARVLRLSRDLQVPDDPARTTAGDPLRGFRTGADPGPVPQRVGGLSRVMAYEAPTRPLFDFLPPPLSTEALVLGSPRNEDRVGLVVKRTYNVAANGHCELADEGDQEPVLRSTVMFERLAAPLVSSVACDADTRAFRDRTDVVVQGSARTYGSPLTQTSVTFQMGDYRREIRVWGDRRAELGANGELHFTAPEPFEEMPIHYYFAYGGYDAAALEANVDPAFEEFKRARPRLDLGTKTPFHYPRNPAGVGFLIEPTQEAVAKVEVPNLEFPFDPVTPERMAVGAPEHWIEAPLPAGFDWFSSDWFPRSAYLGTAKLPSDYEGRIAEIDLGWAAADLLSIRPLLQALEEPLRPEFSRAASPGMSFERLDTTVPIELTHLHPEQPVWTVRLPAEVPQVDLELEADSPTRLGSHLNTIVIRPEFDQVVMTWCAHAPLTRHYSNDQFDDMECRISWLEKDAR